MSSKKRIFNSRQKITMLLWIILTIAFYSYFNKWGNLNKILDNFFNFNLILFGFTLTSVAIITSTLGEELTQRLQKTNAYWSLMSNFYWLMILLFWNLIIGFLLQFFSYSQNKYCILDLFIVFDITLTMLLLWYAVTRLTRFIRYIKF